MCAVYLYYFAAPTQILRALISPTKLVPSTGSHCPSLLKSRWWHSRSGANGGAPVPALHPPDVPRTYHTSFPWAAHGITCPVGGCPGRDTSRGALQVHFVRLHMQDMLVVLEEGNHPLPCCPNAVCFPLEVSEWDTSGHDNVCQGVGVENKVAGGGGGIGEYGGSLPGLRETLGYGDGI